MELEENEPETATTENKDMVGVGAQLANQLSCDISVYVEMVGDGNGQLAGLLVS